MAAALTRAGVHSAEVDDVVLVGGSSRLQVVRDKLSGAFGGREVGASRFRV